MPDASEFMLEKCKSYNGKLSLPETLEAFAQAKLEEYLQETGQFAFAVKGKKLLCKRCGAPFKKAKTLIKHVKAHQKLINKRGK